MPIPDNIQLRVKPRFDLREESFRKYENLIALAWVDIIIIDPTTVFKKPLKAQTFCTRFRDALTAFKRFNYTSKLIPSDFDPTKLQPHELTGNEVIIENTLRAKKETIFNPATPYAEHKDQCRLLMIERATSISSIGDVVLVHKIHYRSPEQLQWILSTIKEVQLQHLYLTFEPHEGYVEIYGSNMIGY